LARRDPVGEEGRKKVPTPEEGKVGRLATTKKRAKGPFFGRLFQPKDGNILSIKFEDYQNGNT